MTLLVEALFTFLSAANTAASDRIYPKRLPQGATLPAITYLLASDPTEHTHSGPSSLAHPRYQLNCWAEGEGGYLAAHSLAEEVRAALDGYRGLPAGVEIQAALSENSRDNDDADTGRHWVSLDFIIWYTRA